MDAYIVGGGSVDIKWLKTILSNQARKYIIAADAGLDALLEAKIVPDAVIGDFDSCKPESKQFIENEFEGKLIRLLPEKDDTDMEAALTFVLENSKSGDIYLIGATGSRIDHVLGNISLLGKGLKYNRSVYILDTNNRIRLIDSRCVLKKESQYGKYVSLIPYTDCVKGVTLVGFKYPLKEYTFTRNNTLGVSNEILENEAYIYMDEGILIVVEARD